MYEFYWTVRRPGAPALRTKGSFDMQKTQNLQDLFLNQTRRDRQTVTLFLMNGFQMRGVITGFDGFVVFLETDGKQQMIYKHAISTVAPLGGGDLLSQ